MKQIAILLILLFGAVWLNAQTGAKRATFKVKKAQTVVEIVEEETDIEMDLFVVNDVPVFPGGDQAMKRFILQNIVYPPEAIEKGIQGVVLVQFMVTETGKIDSVTVLRSTNPILDSEAVRVIKKMPNWTPAKQMDNPISVVLSTPVNFILN